MISRRDVLGTGVAAAGSILGARSAASMSSASQAVDGKLAVAHQAAGADILRRGPLMNLERAYQVMDEQGLNGLVFTHPTNIFHLTGYLDHIAIRHDAPASFVLLARDERQAPGMVMNQFIYYYSFVDNDLTAPLQTYLFTGPDGEVNAHGEPAASPAYVFSDRGDAPIRSLEQERLATLQTALKARPPMASAERALAKAAKEMGLDKGRIGYDHPVVEGTFQSAGIEAETVYADHAIRRIRMIKSPQEIELMRMAAQTNADAALAAVKAVRAGATRNELRATFYAECAKRGNSGLFMQIDTVISEITDGVLKDGSAFSIDCVSLGFHYFGDYGRTIFVGEPSRTMKKTTDAISLGWDAVREQLRPGLRYSEIIEIGQEALRKDGYDFDVPFSPHSVGLAHSDEPGTGGSKDYWAKGNTVLEENMVLSVDLPIKHSGIGGSAHLEDLTVITKDGAEQINDIGDRIVMV